MRRSTTLKGYRFAYLESGAGAQNLLFVHGNSLSSEIFEKQLKAPELQKHFRMIAPDLLGHGKSDFSKIPEVDYHPAGQANLLAEFCFKHKIKNPVLVGQSLGGNVILELVRRIPEFNSIFLVCSAPATKPIDQRIYWPTPAIGLFFQEHLTAAELREMNRIMYAPDYQYNDFLEAIIRQSDPRQRSVLPEMVASGKYEDQKKAIEELKMPINFLFGKDEQVYNWEVIEAEYKQLAKQFFLLDDCGHMPFYEKPEAFNEAILSTCINTEF